MRALLEQGLVIALVALAAVYLVRTFWGKRGTKRDGDCSSCPSAKTNRRPPR